MKEKFEGVAIKFDTVEQRDHLYELAKEAGLEVDWRRAYNIGYFRQSEEGYFYGDYNSLPVLPVVPYADFVSSLPTNRRISSDLISAIESSMVNPPYKEGGDFRAGNVKTDTLSELRAAIQESYDKIVAYIKTLPESEKRAKITLLTNAEHGLDTAKIALKILHQNPYFFSEGKIVSSTNENFNPHSSSDTKVIGENKKPEPFKRGGVFITDNEAVITVPTTPTSTPSDAVYDFIKSQGLSYELCNAVNFICKANKGKKQALYNAKWYIEKAVEHETKSN
jgi:hypothetical protein